jgi:hypothetical protein
MAIQSTASTSARRGQGSRGSCRRAAAATAIIGTPNPAPMVTTIGQAAPRSQRVLPSCASPSGRAPSRCVQALALQALLW